MDISATGFTDEVCSLQPGMNIGNLHIVSFIGKGAIGEVYLAQHEILGKQFALKVIPKGFALEEASEAFTSAARLQTKLEHPCILRIGDMGEEDMFYWLRMEYIEGEKTADGKTIRSLDDLMRFSNGILTEQEVCYYMYYLLLGLAHAHSEGVIHSDLKPANALIADEGVKISELGVTDFIGHAWDDFHLPNHNRLMEPTPFDPLPGFSRLLPCLLNTFEYFSPEQRMGERPTVRSNLYTVGFMVYRMLTGRYRLSMDKPTQTVDGINPGWNDWMTKAIAYNPEDRFQSAVEMLYEMPGLEVAEEIKPVKSEEKAVS